MEKLWIGRRASAVLFTFSIAPFLTIAAANSTPLIDAVKSCQTDQIKALLANNTGGDINTTDQYGFTAVQWNIQRCDAATLQSLLDHGASLPKDKPHFSLIIEAAKHGRGDIITLLLAKGYNANAQDHFGNTALMWAVSAGRVDTAKALLAVPNIALNIQDNHLQTALIKSAQQGNPAILNLLLAQKPSIKLDLQDKFGYTALHWAAHDGNLTAVQALLAAGANKTVRGKDNFLALDLAKRRSHPDCAQALQ